MENSKSRTMKIVYYNKVHINKMNALTKQSNFTSKKRGKKKN